VHFVGSYYIQLYFTLHQTQILGRYINCEIGNCLNKQSNSQQGDKILDSLVTAVVCTSRVGLVIGVMGMR